MRPAVLLLLALSVAAAAVLADEDAARYFTDRGRKALEKKDYEEAEKLFRQALGQHDGYLPAMVGIAEAAIGKGEKDTAIAQLVACLEHAEGAKPSGEAKAARDRAEALLRELDPARLEFRLISEHYVRKLLGLARSHAKKDPGLARRCAERVLKIVPDHAEARKILSGGPPAPKPAPTADAKPGEKRLFNGKDLSGWAGRGKEWRVESGAIVCTAVDCALWIRSKEEIKGDYTLGVEMRFRKDMAGGSPRLAVFFGVRSDIDRFALGAFINSVMLDRRQPTAERVKLAKAESYEISSSFDRNQWNLYRMVVEQSKVTVYVNKRKLFTHQAEAGAFDGFVGLVTQDCTGEFRRIVVNER
jgi:tetratricopeptide (TPR) repeat protein